LFQTKVSLLKGDGRASSDERSLKSEDAADGNLVDLSESPTGSQQDSLATKADPERVVALEGENKIDSALSFRQIALFATHQE
jgi:hypothetical protein